MPEIILYNSFVYDISSKLLKYLFLIPFWTDTLTGAKVYDISSRLDKCIRCLPICWSIHFQMLLKQKKIWLELAKSTASFDIINVSELMCSCRI